jgi:hypothetical protein
LLRKFRDDDLLTTPVTPENAQHLSGAGMTKDKRFALSGMTKDKRSGHLMNIIAGLSCQAENFREVIF